MAKVDDVTYTPAGVVPKAVTAVGRKSILKDLALSYDLPVPLYFRLTAGQFKPPFGMEGMGGNDVLDTLERSMMSWKLKWSEVRDLGAQAQARWGGLDAAAGVFNGEGWNVDGDLNRHRNLNVRTTWRPVGFVTVGAAYQEGRTGINEDLNEHFGGELSLDLSRVVPVKLKGEYAFGASGPRGAAAGVRTGYGTLLLGVVPQVVEFAVKYDWVDYDRRRAGDWLTEATFGINWKLAGDRAKLQLNYLREDEPSPKVKNDVFRAGFQTSY
jgi:hypothetical protein